MFEKILIGYDGSKGAQAALHRAAVLAKKFNAQLTAFWVREPLPRHSDLPGEFEEETEAADDYFKARREEVKAAAEQRGLPIACEMGRGHTAKPHVKVGGHRGDGVLVVGHRGHSELWGRLLGDTANRIADHAPCSVLVVKGYPTAPGQ